MSVDIGWIQANFPDLADVESLATGGQKFVFTGKHATDGPIVLKLIKPNQNVESVRREIAAVQQVHSHRVPLIIEFGQIDTPLGECFWFREQRIIGESLRTAIKTEPLSPHEVLRLAYQMLEALSQAEDAGIVHRDVKPDNIMRDSEGNYWLLDFGLARHLHLESLTATEAPFGKLTWGYAPSEQCRNDKPKIDSRADLFALGVTIFEAAVGYNPHRHGARNHLEILRRVETQPLPPLELPVAESSSFRDMVAAMAQPRRDHRLPSVVFARNWMESICNAEGD